MNLEYIAWYIRKSLEIEKLKAETPCYPVISSSINERLNWFHTTFFKEYAGIFTKRLEENNFQGFAPLISSISKNYQIPEENIFTTNGATNAIFLMCLSFLKQGDHVIVETPCYEPLKKTPALFGAQVIPFKRNPLNGEIDLEHLYDLITSKTKLIFLTNLHNPTGNVLKNDILLQINDAVLKKNGTVLIIVDEIYRDFAHEMTSPAFLLDPEFITISSLTKVYGLGSLKCGWIAAKKEILSKIRQNYFHVEGSGPRIGEAVSSIIIERLHDFLNFSINVVERNRKILRDYIKPLIDCGKLQGKIPQHGCIFFPKIAGIEDTNLFTEKLAALHKVYLVPGSFFGEPEHVRIGFGGDPTCLSRALEIFVSIISSSNFY